MTARIPLIVFSAVSANMLNLSRLHVNLLDRLSLTLMTGLCPSYNPLHYERELTWSSAPSLHLYIKLWIIQLVQCVT